MAFFGKVLNQQLVLLLLVLVGLIVKKLRILNRESEKAVSSLLVNVLLPLQHHPILSGGNYNFG